MLMHCLVSALARSLALIFSDYLTIEFDSHTHTNKKPNGRSAVKDIVVVVVEQRPCTLSTQHTALSRMKKCARMAQENANKSHKCVWFAALHSKYMATNKGPTTTKKNRGERPHH